MGRSLKRRSEDFSVKSVHDAGEESQRAKGLHIAATHSSPTRNREVARKKRSRAGTTSIPYPQRQRIQQRFIAGTNISQIAKIENRHWTTVKRIVEEKDVQEYVKDLRAKFYGALEDVLIAVIQYVKNGKDGGWLGYEMLKDGGVVPQRDAKHHPAAETRKPVNPPPDPEQERITMIAKEMVRRTIERHRFFTTALPEADAMEEQIGKA